MKYLIIITIFIASIWLMYLSYTRNEKLIDIETKILALLFNAQETTGIEFNLMNQTIENIYDKKQEEHEKKTDISIERFTELVETNKIIPARNATFHNINDCHNFKYLSRNGRYEYIVKIEKDENGENRYLKLVDDPVNKGTYNYFNQEGYWWQRSLHHIDVILWLLYGTGYDDETTVYDRLNFYFNRSQLCGGS